MKTTTLRVLSIVMVLWAIPMGAQQTLTVSVEGPGKVTGTGIDCPTDCSETMLPTYIGLRPRPVAPVTIVLTAQPNEGKFFSGWSGGCSGMVRTCTISVPSGGATVAARFYQVTFTVLRITINGQGRVTGGGITCPSMCAKPSFSGPFTITLTATPEAGHTFYQWGGLCEGTAPTCTVNVSGQKDVVANFRAGPE